MKRDRLTRGQEKVFSILKRIPKGRVVSYKELARRLGMHPRALACILSSNPLPIMIPCHRVIYASGRLGGYTPSGKEAKMNILKREGIKADKNRIHNKYFYYFR